LQETRKSELRHYCYTDDDGGGEGKEGVKQSTAACLEVSYYCDVRV